MARNLADAWSWIEKIVRRIARLESGAFLESASVTKGRLRFIGGLLLIDSGGTLQVIGHVNGQGDFVWDGPWALKGPGEIIGDVDITGDLSLLDAGRFASGNVIIEDGKIIIGVGGNQIVIDGATGRITAGSLTIDPSANGGSVKFAGGPEVYASGARLSLYSGTGAFIELDGSSAKVNGPGARWVEVDATGFRLVGLPTAPVASFPGGFANALVVDGGYLKRLT